MYCPAHQLHWQTYSRDPVGRASAHASPVFIWISELSQPLQPYFGLYRQFTITKAAEECEIRLHLGVSTSPCQVPPPPNFLGNGEGGETCRLCMPLTWHGLVNTSSGRHLKKIYMINQKTSLKKTLFNPKNYF